MEAHRNAVYRMPTARYFRFVTSCISVLALAAKPPVDPALSLTATSLSVLDGGRIVSTATVCPGYAFDQFGAAGPRISPNLRWILVDVLGPYEPGSVGRTHAIVQVETGRFVLSPNFKVYLGVPSTTGPLAWASGQRATLRYSDGTTAPVPDRPRHTPPRQACAPPAPGPV